MLHKIKTSHGHSLIEVVSALQKSIRRGLEDDAIYFGVQMHMAGYHEYAWKRLKIIVSEDIGPAAPSLPAQIDALYRNYCELRKKNDGIHEPWRICFVHAIILLVRAPKSRVVDHAVMVHFNAHESQRRPVPDCAVDKHTIRGKGMGRGWEHFFDEGSKLENETGDDSYKTLAREVMVALPSRQRGAPAIGEAGPPPGRNGSAATGRQPRVAQSRRARVIVFAGKPRDSKGAVVTRERFVEIAVRAGYAVVSEVDDRVGLVVSSEGTDKSDMAYALDIPVIDYVEFIDRFGQQETLF